MSGTWNKVALGIALVALALGGFAAYKANQSAKIAYVELGTVFSEFEMTKQYKTKLEATVLARKAVLDSLELGLKAKSRSINALGKATDNVIEDFTYNKEYYLEKAQQFEEDNQALKQKFDAEINKQLNQYLKDYGEKGGYKYIFGANGSGNLMYANEGDNVTPQVIIYINERYKGSAK